jgi:hypothetical protein
MNIEPNTPSLTPTPAASGLCRVRDVMEDAAAGFLEQSLKRTPHAGAWAKLYAASQTLLSAMPEARVAPALFEICATLLGCEEVALVEIKGDPAAIVFLVEEQLSADNRRALIQNGRFLQPMISPGEVWIPWDKERCYSSLIPRRISALVPLWRDEQSGAALLLFDLLPQRSGFDAEDREVLQLLALYAGPCLRSQSRD